MVPWKIKMLYIGVTGQRQGDRFREYSTDVKKKNCKIYNNRKIGTVAFLQASVWSCQNSPQKTTNKQTLWAETLTQTLKVNAKLFPHRKANDRASISTFRCVSAQIGTEWSLLLPSLSTPRTWADVERDLKLPKES